MDTITSSFAEGVLTIGLHQRIDSVNAAECGSRAEALLKEHAPEEVILDAGDLQYISSAGLRVVLKLKKMNPKLRIVNVSTDIYEIFEMTGFTDIITVEKAMRRMSVDGCPVIGRGAKGTVYRYNDDTVIKVYNSRDCLDGIRRERELARKAFVLGIPTAISYDIVMVDDKYGSVFEMLNTESFSALIREHPECMDEYIGEFAMLLRKIHETTVAPGELPDARDLPRKWLRASSGRLMASVEEKLSSMIEALPVTGNLLHCDYHTNNVMYQDGEIMLIDLDTLSEGHPVIELANTYVTYAGFSELDPSNVEEFLGIPAETAKKIWIRMLPVYLGTDDADRIADVQKKASLLGYLRMLHHVLRRDDGSSLCAEHIQSCVIKLEELTENTDTLVF